MIRNFVIGFILSFIYLPLSAQLVPYRSGNLWGYSDKNGQIVVPVQFDEAGIFVHRLELLDTYNAPMVWQEQWTPISKPIATFKKNGLYGIIGSKGQVLSPPTSPDGFQFFPVGKGAYWVQYRDSSTTTYGFGGYKRALLFGDGEQLTPFEYYYVNYDIGCGTGGLGPYIEFATQKPHEYITADLHDKQGVISIYGKLIVPAIWSTASPNASGYTLASSSLDTIPVPGYSGPGYYLIDPHNKIVKKIPSLDYCMGYAGHGFWKAKDKSDNFCLVDNNGNITKLKPYREFWGFNEYGYAWVSDDGQRWSVINKAFEVVFRLPFYSQWRQHNSGYWIQDSEGFWRSYDRHFRVKDDLESLSCPEQVNLCDGTY